MELGRGKLKILKSLEALLVELLELGLETSIWADGGTFALDVVDRLQVADLHLLDEVGDDKGCTAGYPKGAVHQHSLLAAEGPSDELADLVEVGTDVFLGRIPHVNLQVLEVLRVVGLQFRPGHHNVRDPQVLQYLEVRR